MQLTTPNVDIGRVFAAIVMVISIVGPPMAAVLMLSHC